ncbi:hypothetical protein SELMODRAFT_125978 [Selaginella moellendorffii]|uniref:Pentacotripeptide-repeat region of PRORP domain-containing protein n=1 Tax=Selaginella moellendorffii TaxID=88036 RepID=D8SVP4_SELML|nr:hypothetical protein SELMODRAFT_125978 [Selaginella moellendorffii]
MREAKAAFESIKEPNVFSTTILLTAYAQNGHIVSAKSFFDQMSERNIYSWTTLITFFESYKDLESALDTFTRMPAWNSATWNSIVSAHTQAGHMLDFMDFEKFNSEITCNALIWVFLQNGNLDKARDLFESASHRDIVSWNTLLQGYVDWELVEEAANLFERMPAHNAVSCTPNQTTFASVLAGISYVGGLEDARSCFGSMVWDHGIPASAMHFCCVVDVLGRAGQIKDAMDLVESLPYNPMEVEWTALLGASKTQGDIRTGALVASRVTEFDSHNSAAYSLLSNVCSFASEIEVP